MLLERDVLNISLYRASARADTQMTHRKESNTESGHNEMADYGKWTVAKLKEVLRRRDAVTTGRKVDLIERFVTSVVYFS